MGVSITSANFVICNIFVQKDRRLQNCKSLENGVEAYKCKQVNKDDIDNDNGSVYYKSLGLVGVTIQCSVSRRSSMRRDIQRVQVFQDGRRAAVQRQRRRRRLVWRRRHDHGGHDGPHRWRRLLAGGRDNRASWRRVRRHQSAERHRDRIRTRRRSRIAWRRSVYVARGRARFNAAESFHRVCR